MLWSLRGGYLTYVAMSFLTSLFMGTAIHVRSVKLFMNRS